ncbi:MAG: adenylate cyclase, partial [Rhodospirillaceae bacterium]|nr:adenylate cyclase [Rhodospirillaceae bacterium]
IAGTAGDSMLAEFASVVDAVDCATKIQHAVAAANADESPERRMVFRIGINVGDVMVKDGSIFGDSVNIAARLEAMAEPGGICVSREVRDHLRNKGIVVFEDLGEHSMKNIDHPVRAFRVRLDIPAGSIEPTPDAPSGSSPAPEPATADLVAVELAFWGTVKDSSDPSELEAYLERYPAGAFAALAKARGAAFLDTPVEPVIPAAAPEQVAVELAFWQSVTVSDNPAIYEAYLEKYPEGEFSALAKLRLTELHS